MIRMTGEQVEELLALDHPEVMRRVKSGDIEVHAKSEPVIHGIHLMAMDHWLRPRLHDAVLQVRELLAEDELPFDEHLHGRLPDEHGIYVITQQGCLGGEHLRAGRTTTAKKGGLRQRVYKNHFQGTQKGNLRAQLVRGGVCQDVDEAKDWIRANCVVQVAVVKNAERRAWAEAAILSMLRPRFMA